MKIKKKLLKTKKECVGKDKADNYISVEKIKSHIVDIFGRKKNTGTSKGEKFNGKLGASEKDEEDELKDENKITKMKTRIVTILGRIQTKKGSDDVKDVKGDGNSDEINDTNSAGTEDNYISSKNKMKINKKRLLKLFAKRVRSPQDCNAEGVRMSGSRRIKTKFRNVFVSNDKKRLGESDENIKDETKSKNFLMIWLKK